MLGRIPYEIFRQIIKFTYVHESSITSSFNDFDEISLPPIKATHVCRAWRSALLSDPAMWIGIKLRVSKIYLDKLKEVLSRSSSLPLDILIEWRDLSLHQDILYDLCLVISTISREMHRCRQLQIIISESLLSLLSTCLNHSLPMLQKFYFEVFGDSNDLTRRRVLRRTHEALFSGDAPNLTHVHLQILGGMEDLRLSLWKNLSSLHLQFESDAIINGTILLGILQSSPHLRILDISWSCMRPEIACSMPPDYRIPLPCLQQLSLRGTHGLDIVNFVLEHLNLPTKDVNFDITCDELHHRVSGSAPVLHFLAQRHLTFLSITSAFWHLAIEFFEKIDQRLPAASSVFRTTYDEIHTPLNHLPKFLRTFSLSDITHLCLGGISLDSVILRKIFYLLANLRYLCVRHGIGADPPLPNTSLPTSYLNALMPHSHHSNHRTQANSESETDGNAKSTTNITEAAQEHLFPCPLLRTLEVVLVYDPLPSRLDEAYLRVLVPCSRIRKQTGHPFKFIVTCRGSLDFQKDIEARLKAHEDLAAKVCQMAKPETSCPPIVQPRMSTASDI